MRNDQYVGMWGVGRTSREAPGKITVVNDLATEMAPLVEGLLTLFYNFRSLQTLN